MTIIIRRSTKNEDEEKEEEAGELSGHATNDNEEKEQLDSMTLRCIMRWLIKNQDGFGTVLIDFGPVLAN